MVFEDKDMRGIDTTPTHTGQSNCPCMPCFTERLHRSPEFQAAKESGLLKIPETEGKPGRYIERLTSAERKEFPMCTGLLDYAPDALAMIAHVSYLANQKHNPGEDLHHARGKSSDHDDCLLRHQSTRGEWDEIIPGRKIPHRALVAWRAVMSLQEWMEEEYGLALAPAARHADES